MIRSAGCRVWDAEGREYLDFVMGLGAVALGYGHPAVNQAAIEAIASGVVGPLAPVLEDRLARELCSAIPWLESMRFLKTGAEAMAAAVRIARAHTRRDKVLTCGYHGWLDWCQMDDPAVPLGTRATAGRLRYDDPDDVRQQCRMAGDTIAAIVVEPVIEREPTQDWLEVLRDETDRAGIVLVFDEIKTGFRIALGGAGERYGVKPDLAVFGKALANGFPLAVVGGNADIMSALNRTWISSTLATEMVALAAGCATLETMIRERVPETLHRTGAALFEGLALLAERHPHAITAVRGIPEMCYLEFRDETVSSNVAREAARHGLFFKRTAYNFVSTAHADTDIRRALDTLDLVCAAAR
jgi:glutamate-1-semialdehyde 2,1-aminomutase